MNPKNEKGMKRKLIIILVLFLSIAGTLRATDYVAISEILYDSPLSNFGEFIELYNVGSDPANLAGWQIVTPTTGQSYTFSEVVLAPHSFLIVAFGNPGGLFVESCLEEGLTDFHILFDMEPNSGQILFQTQMTLPDDSATVILKDNTGKVRDSVQYGEYPGWNSLIANNQACTNSYDVFYHVINTVQRLYISFDLQGCASFDPSNWTGMYGDPQYGRNSPMSSNLPLGANIISPDVPVRNYIVMVTPTVAMDSIPEVNNEMQLDSLNAIVQINYFDGLGRPMETVQKAFTPLKKNLLTYTEYDSYGRPAKEWLPIAVDFDYMERSPFQSASQMFYTDESRAYTEYKYSTDTLPGGVLCNEQTGIQAPGADMNNHYAARKTLPNEANTVKLFRINNSNLQVAGYYSPKTLLYEQITDEDGKVSRVYKNKQGQMVMKRQINGATPNSMTFHDTYYVYNDLGQLCYMLPPLATDALSSGTYSDNHDILKKYAYLYKYDNRGNCTEKRLPGCEPMYQVFDQANRPVLSQDGVQRTKNQWLVNKYDALGRLLYTGTMTGSNSHQSLQNTLRTVVVTESYTGSNGFASTGYSCNHFPNQITPLSVNYYDDYAFLSLLPSADANNMAYQPRADYGVQYSSARGLVTGSRTYLLDGSGNYLTTSLYYDYREQMVQSHSKNHWGGYNHEYNQYSFTGKPLKTLKQQNVTTLTSISISELYEYTYDHADRLLTTIYQINNKPAITLVSNEYDELGRLQGKLRHNGEDSESFEYDIRNRLTKITSGGFEENLYYHANLPQDATACYNGNIAAITWKYDNQLKGYRYSYDQLNRLVSGLTIHTTNAESYGEYFTYDKHGNISNLFRLGATTNSIDYLTMVYNGNQLTYVFDEYGNRNQYNVKEYHDADPYNYTPSAIEFTYDANGNMVSDKDRNISSIRYNLLNLPDTIQFGNGNQIINLYSADGRKLTSHYFTLVTPVVVPLGQTRQWQYAMDVIDETGTIYVDNCEYRLFRDPDPYTNLDGISLLRIHNPEGYTGNTGITGVNTTTPQYRYYRRDHLGNNREVWAGSYLLNNKTKPALTNQRTQYYPSGLPWSEGLSPSIQPYKYNGKEFIEMHGYDTYDYGARGMHAAKMRFDTMDPLAEKYPETSPYAYCLNNPVKYIDPDGRTVYFYQDNGNGRFDQVEFSQLDATTQEWLYGWMNSGSGQEFLSNFVDGEQSFTWDGNTVTIQGNGNNYDAQYTFGNAETQIYPDGSVYTVHGKTEWSLYNDKPVMQIHTDIHQSTADQIATFGHEQTVHADKDVEYLNKNFVRGAANNSEMVTGLNSSGATDHAAYNNQNSSQYKNMRRFIAGMKGWMGSAVMDRALTRAFRNEHLNNRNNVKRGK
ncbi:hypothetical protein FACS1894182_10120 [Bacteroidia bacterium]|nr:hypothetical protein FACS1894182_10120 [Bacteroidia bacterium]